MDFGPILPAGVETVCERRHERLPLLVHPRWDSEMPWLVQGTTVRIGADGSDFDLGLFTGASRPEIVRSRLAELLSATELRTLVLARQPHGSGVAFRRADEPAGVRVAPDCDGHVSACAGILLAVAIADCVPVLTVAPDRRGVAALHAGWRGTAAGVLEAGLSRLAAEAGCRAGDVHVHLGPAICGRCYEVGPEVFEALGLPPPRKPEPIDLRAVLARRAVAHGVDPAHLTVSSHCTRCTGSGLYSHRGGDLGRQLAVVGVLG